MRQTEAKEKQEIDVSRLHFLIHPGFNSCPEDPDGEEDVTATTPLDAYVRKAESLGQDEIMFIVLHVDERRLKKDALRGLQYAKCIMRICEILGLRAIVLHDWGATIFEEPTENLANTNVVRTAKRLARERGFRIPQDAESEAYGETLPVCVVNAAESLNMAFRLTNETIIRTRLTDRIHATNDDIQRVIREIRALDNLDCIVFEEEMREGR